MVTGYGSLLFWKSSTCIRNEDERRKERDLYPRVVVSRRLNNPFPWFKAGKLPCSEAEGRNLFRLARLVTQRNTLERNDAWQRRRFLKEAATSEPSSKTIKGRPGAVKKKRKRRSKPLFVGKDPLSSRMNRSFKISGWIKAAKASLSRRRIQPSPSVLRFPPESNN